jgi:hypothetical protein
MGDHEYPISGELQIEFQGVSAGLDGALDGGEGVLWEFPLVASMGDGLWEAWNVVAAGGVEEMGLGEVSCCESGMRMRRD